MDGSITATEANLLDIAAHRSIHPWGKWAAWHRLPEDVRAAHPECEPPAPYGGPMKPYWQHYVDQLLAGNVKGYTPPSLRSHR